MVLTEEQRKELERVARPMVQWICENCHPHVTVIVEPGSVELVEGVCAIPITDFIRS